MTEERRVRVYYVTFAAVVAAIGIWALTGGGLWPLSLLVLPAFLGWWWAIDERPSWGWWDDARWWQRLLLATPAGLVVAFFLVAPLAEVSVPVAVLLVAQIVALLGLAAWTTADRDAWVPAGVVVLLLCGAGVFVGSDRTFINRHCLRTASSAAQYEQCDEQMNDDRITGRDSEPMP